MVPRESASGSPIEVDTLPQLAPRGAESHKGDFGRAVLIGGSTGMSGAISLSGMSALRSGAGLVRLAVPRDCQSTVSAFEPSYMTLGLTCDAAGRIALADRDELKSQVESASALACGPGLGRSADLNELVAWLYAEVSTPIVFDADALNALAEQPELLKSPGGPRVLTPHPGEFSRLTGVKYDDDPQARRKNCFEFARSIGATIVLKGHQTCISDGRQIAVNSTGNPGMATGGTGDVLTGVITALLCQGLDPFDAAHLGVHVHGLAGDYAAEELGQVSLIASDLVRHLPAAFKSLQLPGSTIGFNPA